MRWIFMLVVLFSTRVFSQLQSFKLGDNGDTLNRVDAHGMKQGPWVMRYETVRGEPGYEEEGKYINNRKEGEWKLFNLMGDMVGTENYRWGFKDGVARYYTTSGALRLEQSWKALNPDKQYDTLVVEDVDKLDTYHTVVVKNEGASLKHGIWNYYDPETGALQRSETYMLGKIQSDSQTAQAEPEKKSVAKPKEVLDFEKKNSGKKKVKYRDGSTGGY